MTACALYVPTDRPAAAAVTHGLAECAELRELTGRDYLFMLVEHGAAGSSAANRSALEHGSAASGVPALHLSDLDWPVIARRIVAEAGLTGPDADRAAALLDPRDLAYGAGPNKAFLLAAALGTEVLHRRDSDLEPDVADGAPRYPGVLEVRAIGRPVAGIDGLAGAGALPAAAAGRRVQFVGSTCFGDAPQDRRDIVAAGLTYATALQALTRPAGTATPGLAGDVEEYFVAEGRRRHPVDHLALDPDASRVEVGVSCVTGIFRQLPEMPMTRTLGTDYRQRNLLTQIDAPVVFQSRKMRHVYGSDRRLDRPAAAAAEYAMRDLRLTLLWVVSWRQRELIRQAPGSCLRGDGTLDAARHADTLRAALSDVRPRLSALPERFAAIHREAAAATGGPRSVRLAAIADAATRQAAELVADVVRGVQDYIWLAERWPALVAAAPAVAADVRKLVLN